MYPTNYYPWSFFWAPQVHFPWSGNVAQDIDTSWFFDSIDPKAGDGRIEKKAFGVASYGRQLGLITEVLIDLAEKVIPQSEQGKDALRRLQDIKTAIDRVKDIDASTQIEDIEARVTVLKQSHKGDYPRLQAELQKLIGPGDV